MKNIAGEMVRIGKVFTRDVDRLNTDRKRKIDRVPDIYIESVKADYVKKINDQFEMDLQRKREIATNELNSYRDDARKNVRTRVTKAPTEEQMRLFSALGQLENLDPRLANLYTPILCDTQIGCELYSQILAKHGMSIPVPSIECQLNAPELMSDIIGSYIQTYNGEDNFGSVMAKEMHDHYFQPEDFFSKTDVKSSEEALRHFWNNKIGFGTPALLDDENPNSGNLPVKYFFTNLDGMIDFINEKTKGLEGPEKTDKVNELLEYCPDTYAAEYRYYLATGKKPPLMEDRKSSDQDDVE